jgi:hypothetical protein
MVLFENLKAFEHTARALLNNVDPIVLLTIAAYNHAFAKVGGQASAGFVVRQNVYGPHLQHCNVSQKRNVLGLLALFDTHENIHVVVFLDREKHHVRVAFHSRVSPQTVY